MRAIDTNVLVRLIARDNSEQAEVAEGFIAKGAWVSHLVLAETVRVLEFVYDLQPEQLATAVDMLLSHKQLILQEAEVVASALTIYRRQPALGFSDCLILEIA